MEQPTTSKTPADTDGRTTTNPRVPGTLRIAVGEVGRSVGAAADAKARATCTFLRARGVTVSIRYVDREHAVLRLGPPRAGGGSTTTARLVCGAMSEARARGIATACIALELAQPTSAVVLAALRARIGKDLSSLDLHRAGSSVILTATLLHG